jgi:hypothetical protein
MQGITFNSPANCWLMVQVLLLILIAAYSVEGQLEIHLPIKYKVDQVRFFMRAICTPLSEVIQHISFMHHTTIHRSNKNASTITSNQTTE